MYQHRNLQRLCCTAFLKTGVCQDNTTIANPFRQFKSLAGGNGAFCSLKGLTAPGFLVGFNDNLTSRNT